MRPAIGSEHESVALEAFLTLRCGLADELLRETSPLDVWGMTRWKLALAGASVPTFSRSAAGNTCSKIHTRRGASDWHLLPSLVGEPRSA